MSAREIANGILTLTTREELNVILAAYRLRSDELTARTAREFAKGETVKFTAQGREILARIDTVNQKSLSVTEINTSGTLSGFAKKWRVAPTFCQKVS
jgi:hypothetical protein